MGMSRHRRTNQAPQESCEIPHEKHKKQKDSHDIAPSKELPRKAPLKHN